MSELEQKSEFELWNECIPNNKTRCDYAELDEFERLLINGLTQKLSEFQKAKGKSYCTKTIKDTFASLIETKYSRYRIYANKRSEDNQSCNSKDNKPYYGNKEWLFDFLCCEEDIDKPYIITNYVLAMECEWEGQRQYNNKSNTADSGASYEKDLYGSTKYDFQKLLVSNCKYRIMIFKRHKSSNEITKYFEDAINSCNNIKNNERVLCLAFDYGFKRLWYKLFVK